MPLDPILINKDTRIMYSFTKEAIYLNRYVAFLLSFPDFEYCNKPIVEWKSKNGDEVKIG